MCWHCRNALAYLNRYELSASSAVFLHIICPWRSISSCWYIMRIKKTRQGFKSWICLDFHKLNPFRLCLMCSETLCSRLPLPLVSGSDTAQSYFWIALPWTRVDTQHSQLKHGDLGSLRHHSSMSGSKHVAHYVYSSIMTDWLLDVYRYRSWYVLYLIRIP